MNMLVLPRLCAWRQYPDCFPKSNFGTQGEKRLQCDLAQGRQLVLCLAGLFGNVSLILQGVSMSNENEMKSGLLRTHSEITGHLGKVRRGDEIMRADGPDAAPATNLPDASETDAEEAGVSNVEEAAELLTGQDSGDIAVAKTKLTAKAPMQLATSTFVSLCMVLGLLLIARLAVPPLVESVRYSWSRGQLRAEYELSDERLKNVSLDSLSDVSQLVSQRAGPSVVHIKFVARRWVRLSNWKVCFVTGAIPVCVMTGRAVVSSFVTMDIY